MRTALNYVITLITGIVAGIFIHVGIAKLQERQGSPGGEIFLLPLFAMLVYFGYMIAKEVYRPKKRNKYR